VREVSNSGIDIDSSWGLMSARRGCWGRGGFPVFKGSSCRPSLHGAATKQMLLSWRLCEGATFVKLVTWILLISRMFRCVWVPNYEGRIWR
jgi:hypothetical protein